MQNTENRNYVEYSLKTWNNDFITVEDSELHVYYITFEKLEAYLWDVEVLMDWFNEETGDSGSIHLIDILTGEDPNAELDEHIDHYMRYNKPPIAPHIIVESSQDKQQMLAHWDSIPFPQLNQQR